MTKSTGVSMKNEEAKTAFIAGYEIDAAIARTLMDATLPSVKRVVEEGVIAGWGDDRVKAAAKTTAEAVVGAIVDLLISKATVADPAHSTHSEDLQVSVGSQAPEGQ